MGLFNFLKTTNPPQEWVDLIFEPGTPARNVSMAILQKSTQERVANCMRIMQDCTRLMKSSKNPDTFFTRYQLFDDQLYFLVCLEPFYQFKGWSPSKFREDSIAAREETVEPFLRVQFNEVWNVVRGNYSMRVKRNHLKKYMEMLDTYKAQIPDNVFSRYQWKSQKLIKELEKE